MGVRLGLHIPSFSYGTGVQQLFATVVEQAREAESAGFDAVFVMDHFYQLPMFGRPDEPMLEAYTTLGALAAATETIQLGALVTGNSYRNPALLAKAITTLDVVSRGRAILGMGTGWYRLEHDQLGFDFGTFTERFDKLGEALSIIVPMIEGSRPTFSGRHYKVANATAEPRFRERIPLLIGGSGEKKTIPLAVEHFDHFNIVAPIDMLAGKVEAVRQRCEIVGRDPGTLETSALLTVALNDGPEPGEVSPDVSNRMLVGSPESIAEQIGSRVLDAGVAGVVLHVDQYRPGAIRALAEVLNPVLA